MYAGLPISRLEPHVYTSQTAMHRQRDAMQTDSADEEWENFVREKKTPGVLIAPISPIWDKRDVEGLGVELGIAMKRPVGKTVLLRRLGMAHVDLPDPRAEKAAMLMGSYKSSRGLLSIYNRVQEMGPPTGRGTYGSMQLSSQVQGAAAGYASGLLPVRGGAPAPRRVRSLSLSSTSSSSSSSYSDHRSKKDKRRARRERRKVRKSRRNEPESFLLQSESGPPECRRCRFTLPYVYPPSCPECKAYLRPSDDNDANENSDSYDRDHDHDRDRDRERDQGRSRDDYHRDRDYRRR